MLTCLQSNMDFSCSLNSCTRGVLHEVIPEGNSVRLWSAGPLTRLQYLMSCSQLHLGHDHQMWPTGKTDILCNVVSWHHFGGFLSNYSRCTFKSKIIRLIDANLKYVLSSSSFQLICHTGNASKWARNELPSLLANTEGISLHVCVALVIS